ncbi:MAG TPA: ComEC/Rec2 family competence protein, partial [Thermoanaerobaculia bacterium]
RAGWAPPELAVGVAAGGVAWRGRAGLALAAAAVGMLAAVVAAPAGVPAGIDAERPVAAVGRVVDHWRVDGDEASVRFRLSRVRQGLAVARTALEVRLVLPAMDGLPRPGTELRVKGALRRSPGFANTIAAPPGPWRLRVKSRRLVETLAPPGPVAALSARWRGRVEAAMAAAVAAADGVGGGPAGDGEVAAGEREESAAPPAKSAGHGASLARALVLADPSELPETWRRGLRRSGLAHLLAVSGLHVGLVAGTVLLAGAFLPWRLRLVLALPAIGGYLLLAGPRPALLRAAAMGGLAAVSLLAARVPVGANALAVAVGAMVLARPALLDDLGFRLTVTATAGILLLAPALTRRWAGDGRDGRDPAGTGRSGGAAAGLGTASAATSEPSRRRAEAPHPARRRREARRLAGRGFLRLRRLLAPPLATTVAAQLASLPVAAPAFHLLSWTAPLTNLVAVPWTALALAACLLWTAVALVDPATAGALLPALDLLAAPFGWPALGPPGRWGTLALAAPPVVALLVAALLAAWLPAPRCRLPFLAAALVLLPALRWGDEGPRRHAGVETVFLDVGQGDATLLRDGPRALLVDGGGWPSGDLGGRVLVPALVGEGLARLDAVLLTHPDRDHCRGLVDLASYLPIGELWLARGLPRDGCAGELAAAVAGQGGAVREVEAGERRTVGRWRLDVLHPAAPEGEDGLGAAPAADNDDSVVVLAAAAGWRLLLPGDVEAPAERRLLAARRDLLAADLLKLAHHGSKSSTTPAFLAAVAPRLAVASAGHRNPYGHPAELVLHRLRQRGVPLLRTDRHGMVHLVLPPEGPFAAAERSDARDGAAEPAGGAGGDRGDAPAGRGLRLRLGRQA